MSEPTVGPFSRSPTTGNESPVRIGVASETGRLECVIVHTPGIEVNLVSPANREDLLFEDILFLDEARREHEQMCAVFEIIIGSQDGVLQLASLLRESFESADARESFVERLCREVSEMNLLAVRSELLRLEPDELHQFALTGDSALPVFAQPVPNLLFTRDLASAVGDHVIVGRPATRARAREAVIMDTVFSYHPAFASISERIIRLPDGVTFEGGDLIVASDKVVMIGHSERTTFGGVLTITRELLERTPVEHVVLVNLPKKRWCMHLDTVFTFASGSECVIFPPIIELTGHGNVVHFSKGERDGLLLADVSHGLKSVLEHLLDRTLTFIPCGGFSLLDQQREQWTDGSNFFAPMDGVVLGYERNDRTFAMMEDHGYRVVTADGFLSFYQSGSFDGDEKVAIKLEGKELSRGRGGPRCMTLPLARALEA
jgi:arginine deiminase